MLLFLILLVAFSEARQRTIVQIKDAYNATNLAPDLVRDPGWLKSIGYKFMKQSDILPFNAGFKSWIKPTWAIDLATALYIPDKDQYNFTNGYAFPTTIKDPQHKIIYDSVYLDRGITKDWTVSVSAWTVLFNTTYVVPSGPNAGSLLNPLNALFYMKFFFLKTGKDWSNPLWKETMPCQTDVAATYFANQYVSVGFWGGFDDVISYTCFDHTTRPPTYCDKYEINKYYALPNSVVNETARVNYRCGY